MNLLKLLFEVIFPIDPFNPVCLVAAYRMGRLPTGCLLDELGNYLMDNGAYLTEV